MIITELKSIWYLHKQMSRSYMRWTHFTKIKETKRVAGSNSYTLWIPLESILSKIFCNRKIREENETTLSPYSNYNTLACNLLV